MKSSKYTTVIRNGGEYIIYNTLYDKLLICNQDIIDLLNKHSDFDSLKDIHPSLFKNYVMINLLSLMIKMKSKN